MAGLSQPSATSFDREAFFRKAAERYNSMEGDLDGMDCRICKNKGLVLEYIGGEEIYKPCECEKTRRALRAIEKSGLKHAIELHTFENYQTSEPWQKAAKELAERYVIAHADSWFYAGGQIGSGKTHLCTAIVGVFLRKGVPAKYMPWRDEVVQLKANINDETAYQARMDKLKTARVLYIDDFLKTTQGKEPTAAETAIAFELINYRYNNPDLLTLISSERNLDELMAVDEAVGSRIYQKAKDFCLIIGANPNKNYRINGRKE